MIHWFRSTSNKTKPIFFSIAALVTAYLSAAPKIGLARSSAYIASPIFLSLCFSAIGIASLPILAVTAIGTPMRCCTERSIRAPFVVTLTSFSER
jgi:hypothetical protein